MYRKKIKEYLPLYLVIDRASCQNKDMFFVMEQAIKGGVTIVQLREKEISAREFVELAIKTKDFLSKYNIPLIINDRIDVALASKAEGVHVGQEDIHPNYVREIVGDDLIIGLSVNNEEHVKEANELDIDYVGIGPVFKTLTKKDPKPTLYPHGLKRLLKLIQKPSVAIGGINIENCKEVVKTGVNGIAVVSAICKHNDPFLAASKLKTCITHHDLKN